MMREILKEERQPLCGVCAHTEIDNPIVNLGIDLNLITLRLGGDRLPRPPSAVLGDFILRRARMNDLVASASPFFFLNFTVNFGRLSVTRNKVGVKLEIGEAFIL